MCKVKRVVLLVTAFTIILSSFIAAVAFFDGEVYAAKVKKPAKVKIASVKRSGLKITVKWKKAKNARKYQIYQKIGSGKWKLKKTIKKLTLTVNGSYGKTYSFKVRAVNGKKKGSFSAIKKVTIPKRADEKKDEEKDESQEHTSDDLDEDFLPGENPGEESIVIVREPKDVTINEDSQVNFTVLAKGEGLTYQWYKSIDGSNKLGEKIEGANSSILSLTASASYVDASFYCIVACETGKLRTRAAKLSIIRANRVYIKEQPKTQSVYEGDNANYSLTAIGEGELQYQWYVNDEKSTVGAERLEGEVFPTLTIPNTRLNMDGRYYFCKVMDEISLTTSNIVRLSVSASPKRTAFIRDFGLFFDKYGVLSEETLSIDGAEYYVLAKEDDKALLLAKDANYFTGTLAGGLESLNISYFASHPTMDIIALDETIRTRSSYNGNEYRDAAMRAFALTEADVTGNYSGAETQTDDFTFNKTDEHIGVSLPENIAKLYVDGSPARWALRSPSPSGKYAMMVETAEDGITIRGQNYGEGFYIRPAFWVDLSSR